MAENTTFSIATANIIGSHEKKPTKPFNPAQIAADMHALLEAGKRKPDILAIQESHRIWEFRSKTFTESSKELALRLTSKNNSYTSFFATSVDSDMHIHDNKWSNTFSSHAKVTQGNAIISNKPIAPWPWPSPPTKHSKARNPLPISTQISSATLYSTGNRDTEPRNLIIAPFFINKRQRIYVMTTHLTTLTKEKRRIPENPHTKRASKIRQGQVRAILDTIKELREAEHRHNKVPCPLIIAGDFNAQLKSPELSLFTQNNILSVPPRWDDDQGLPIYTHRGHKLHIDHIFYHDPAKQLVVEDCVVLYSKEQKSDHFPVIARFSFSISS